MTDDWGDLAFFDADDQWDEETESLKKSKIPEEVIRARAQKTRDRQIMRRAASEHNLRDVLDWHLEKGSAYHVISGGDIDFLSYVRMIAEVQPIDYLIISTWVMAMADAEEMADWLSKGYVKRIDLYAGERSIDHYAQIWDYMERVIPAHGGRMVTCKNHSKVAVMYGRDYDAVIESSANVNTNPRIEQSTVTVSSELCDFYKEFYDGLKSIRPWPYKWEPWDRGR